MHCLRGRSAKGRFSAAGTLGPIPLGNLFNLVADTAKPAYTCHLAARPHARLVRANPGEVDGPFRTITTEYELAPNTSLSSVTGYPGTSNRVSSPTHLSHSESMRTDLNWIRHPTSSRHTKDNRMEPAAFWGDQVPLRRLQLTVDVIALRETPSSWSSRNVFEPLRPIDALSVPDSH